MMGGGEAAKLSVLRGPVLPHLLGWQNDVWFLRLDAVRRQSGSQQATAGVLNARRNKSDQCSSLNS
jgi:hypothetical protein